MNRKGWPLWIVALSAAVAIWAGWVKLGALCGFGEVTPLPGIVGWRLDAAITLPAGIEAYGAYALGVWLSPKVAAGVRQFAGRSAIGALTLGASAQVISHLLAAAHATRAPWPVVVLVSCVPVVTLGFAAALTHLLRSAPEAESEAAETPAETPAPVADAPEPKPVALTAPAPLPEAPAPPAPPAHSSPSRTRTRPARTARTARTAPVLTRDPLTEFAAEVARGVLPSQRAVQKRMHTGWDKAGVIRGELEQAISGGKGVLVTANGNGSAHTAEG